MRRFQGNHHPASTLLLGLVVITLTAPILGQENPQSSEAPSAEQQSAVSTEQPTVNENDVADSADASASLLLSLAEEAMTTIDYQRSRDFAARAIAKGGLELEDLTRAYRVFALSLAQRDELAAAEQAFLKLFALEPASKIAMRLAPMRRTPVMNARGFWAVRKAQFGMGVDYARRDRKLIVHIRDPIHWAHTVHIWSRFGDNPYVKVERPVAGELVVPVEGVDPIDNLEVYAFVTDPQGNTLMRFGRDSAPHLFQVSETELGAIMRRDIRGGQTGSFAKRLEEFGGQVSLHGYTSLEFKPVGSVPSFDLHHITTMIRAHLIEAVSLEFAFEWEHLARSLNDIYLPHGFIDTKLSDWFVLRAGLFEVPIGAFNEYLYPDFLRITGSPPLFSRSVVPTLWSEVGVQARGRAPIGTSTHFTYAAFVSNGLEQRDPEPTNGVVQEGGDLRDMRFNDRDKFSGNKAFGGRMGLELGEFDFGVSGYSGRYTIERSRLLHIIDSDLSYRGRWLTVRAEGAITFQETTSLFLNKNGFYTLVAIRALPHLEPYAQYDFVDINSPLQRGLAGAAFYPFPHQRATRSLRLKAEAGYEFPQARDPSFIWFLQLTSGF